ncbi:hypothetical protein BN59_01320 [Legionella massiliensis]|uniref:Uncharacterized protein n=1 Tax=Legionella massiliensis TaxID=1034943 RepID=A0A078KVN2_9GAMM|nr:hypothetical protein BN59_01320 [Legionella massiliensis]CEE12779.1 hypothetical protein BN1094_01320 [Legionella massiliensis]
MIFQCKYCKKRMEPRVEIKERLLSTNEQTFYCSSCGKQLFILGSLADKPSWNRFGFLIDFLIPLVWEVINSLEIFKALRKKLSFRKRKRTSTKDESSE